RQDVPNELYLDNRGRTGSGCRKDVSNFLFSNFNEGLNYVGVKLRTAAIPESFDRLFVRKPLAVATIRNHRIVGIDYRYDPRSNRYFLSFQASRIARAVVAFMVVKGVKASFLET